MKKPENYTVCHVSSLHARDDTRIYFKMCKSLHRAGYDVTLVVADGKGDEVENGIRIIDAGKRFDNRILRTLITSYRTVLKALYTDSKIYHFHDPELLPFWLLFMLIGKNIIYDAHEDVPRQIMNNESIPMRLRKFLSIGAEYFERISSFFLSGVIGATNKITNRFPSGKSLTLHNYPLLNEFPRTKISNYLERPPNIVYVGTISEARGIHEMSEAMKILPSSFSAKLILAGRFSPSALIDLLANKDISNFIDYRGWVSRNHISNLLAESRIGLLLLHPFQNYIDSMPIKLFEYMAVGLPVIASDFPSIRKIVSDNSCGILVDPLNPEKIAEAIRWLLENPQKAQKMGERGRAAIEEKYNWDSEEIKLVNFYQRPLK